MRRGTYSIVARDPATGQLGVAVQSHWFAVGAVVPWLRVGVGAVATQSIAEVAHGPRALERLATGEEPASALAGLLGDDPLATVRQVAVIGAAGPPAVHTGDGCIAYAGDVAGEDFACQANMMAAPTVPAAMARAYRGASGDFADRLLAALDAAQAEGGDVRGQQSAALVVAPAQGDPWERPHDLRVDDHPEPLVELRRLVGLSRAYELAETGDELLGAGRSEEAAVAYQRAAELAPDAHELRFWAGLGIAETDLAAGVEEVRRAADAGAGWLALLDRLPERLAPAAPAVRRALGRE